MSLEENKAIIYKLAEAFNTKNEAVIEELIAPDFVDHAMQLKGRDAYKQMENRIYEGFPDIQRTIEHIVAESDTVWFLQRSTGTHTGEYHGIPPTGRKFSSTGVVIYRIVDGKVKEKVSQVLDLLEFYKQIGVIDYKGFPDESTSQL